MKKAAFLVVRRRSRYEFRAVTMGLAGLVLGVMCWFGGVADEPREPKLVKLSGVVTPLAEELASRYPVDLPREWQPVLVLRTTDGKLYTLLHTRTSTAVFLDKWFHGKRLLITGRLFPDSMVFEPTRYHREIDGEMCEVFYWCDICSIKSLSPEDCACCQDPVILKELPVGSAFVD